jgi:hydroxymethylpyrimidine pyrophosphatase-like HAD family hydrolase
VTETRLQDETSMREATDLRFAAIATDGDGTLLKGGRMETEVVAALKRYRDAGGLLFLVTGETVKELEEFPHVDLFDRVICENGPVIYHPATGEEKVLCDGPPRVLQEALGKVCGQEIKCGHVLISTKTGHEKHIREVLNRLQLDWTVINNRKDLLILPKGITKVTGLTRVLDDLRLKPGQVAAIGDAENDAVMLDFCGLGVAVADAVPRLKKHAQLITKSGAGRGVIELIDRLLANDLPNVA